MQKVKAAIKDGIDVNMVTSDQDRKTPLILAAEGGHKDVMSLLISNHAMVDGQDHYGTNSESVVFVDCSNLKQTQNYILNLIHRKYTNALGCHQGTVLK